MKSFKKRTIALVLASVVSIAGSFAADRYKNSVMSFKFETNENSTMSLFVETEKPHSGTLSLSKKDAFTYVLVLPEMNSKASTPDLTEHPNIESISVNTLPYTNNGKGYTRVVVKTKMPVYINAQPRLYLPSEEDMRRIREAREEERRKQEELRMHQEELRRNEQQRREQEAREAEQRQQRNAMQDSQNASTKTATSKQDSEVNQNDDMVSQNDDMESNIDEASTSYQDDSSEKYTLVLAVLLIIFLSAFLFMRARGRMTDVAGEKIQIDLNDEKQPQQKKKETENKKSQKDKPIRPLPSKIKLEEEVSEPSQPIIAVSEENSDIVDLDALFQEKINEEDENEALEEFLNGFSFDEDAAKKEAEEESRKLNEAFYNSVIKSTCLKFSQEDIDRLNKLLSSEILDDTLKNISNYLVSNPIKPKLSPEKILEGFVTTFSVSNNITFTKDDMDALYKIITVEFDKDFVTNLRVDPNRTKQMEEELKAYHKDVRKPVKEKVLKVKKELPDLTKVTNNVSKNVKSEYKSAPMDYSQNCQVETLEVDLNVDFSTAKEESKKEKEPISLVENNWETETLHISDMLPDLNDAMQNPDKYKTPEPEKFVADADSLLAGLSNITFKPFDDNSKEFEIINNSEELESLDEPVIELRSSADVQEELQRWYELEHLGVPKEPEMSFDFNNEETNKSVNEINVQKPVKKQNPRPVQPQIKPVPQRMQQVPKQVNTPAAKPVQKPAQPQQAKTSVEQQNLNPNTKCVWDNQAYNVASSINFDEKSGCHLVKNDSGYVILGFINDKLFKIKDYQELKSEKIQARLSENLPNGHSRYLVRIGINKIIVDVSETEVKYVLELC